MVLVGMKSHPVPMTSRGFGLFPSLMGCHKHLGGRNVVSRQVGSMQTVGACLQTILGVALRRPRAQTIACKQAPTSTDTPCKLGRVGLLMPARATLG